MSGRRARFSPARSRALALLGRAVELVDAGRPFALRLPRETRLAAALASVGVSVSVDLVGLLAHVDPCRPGPAAKRKRGTRARG